MFNARARVQLKENYTAMKNLVEAFKFAKGTDVLVGIPQESTSVYPSGITNVELMYIHTHGSPVRGIPARPTIEPAITDPTNRAVLQKELGSSLKYAFLGNLNGALSAKKRAGMQAVNMVKARFGSGALAPLSPATIARKGSSAPLIDTGQLRNSITYVIRKK